MVLFRRCHPLFYGGKNKAGGSFPARLNDLLTNLSPRYPGDIFFYFFYLVNYLFGGGF